MLFFGKHKQTYSKYSWFANSLLKALVSIIDMGEGKLNT